MKRRPFLTSISALGLASLIPKNSKANNTKSYNSTNIEEYLDDTNYIPSVLQKIENEYISFVWMTDASATIIDKKNGATWQMASVAIQEEEEIERNHVWVRQDRSSCEQYAARFRGELIGVTVRFTILNLELKPVGIFKCKAVLENDFLAFNITEIDEKLPNLMFPPSIENDTLVLPQGAGKLIKESWERKYLAWVAHLNMRFVAGLNKQNNGYLAIFDAGFEDSGILQIGTTVTPVWQKSLGKYAASRTVKYTFSTGGYVGIAKKYKIYALANDLVRTLEEKIKNTPQLKSLLGGRQITFYQCIPRAKLSTIENRISKISKIEKAKFDGEHPKPNVVFTHKDVKNITKDVKENWGFKKGIIHLRGWINGGYDYSHPDVWPPEPLLGTVEELKAICATEANYFTMLHDNYQDIYKQNSSFPKGINIDKKGNLMKGGMWPGGQAYILNSRDSLNYAKRNWEQIKQLQTGGMFVDTTSAVQLYESYETGNTSTKAEDLRNKQELVIFYKSKNQVFGSEETADFAVKDMDFFETRHARKAGETVPLWALVFHDCAFTCRYVDKSNMELTAKPWLEDMLWGYFVLFRMGNWGKPEWKQQKQEFMDSLPVDDWFAKIGTLEMTNHEFLGDDFEVEKTTFSNGKSVTVNFSKQAKTIAGKVYEPLMYVLG